MTQTKKENKINTTTMEELGAVMPCGITPAGATSPIKAFEIKKWRMKEERELGALRDKNRSTVGTHIATVISTMCTKIGPYDFTQLSPAEKALHISQMVVGDVFYIYAWLRAKSLGPKLKLEIKCPSCGHKFKYMADLNTLEISVVDNVEETQWEYKLEESFQIRGKDVTKLVMEAPRWITMEGMKDIGNSDVGAVKANLISGSIIAITDWPDTNGQPTKVALSSEEIDDMSKIDIETIAEQIDEHTVGPNMSINDECPKCHGNYIMPINWTYDSFFGSSGR